MRRRAILVVASNVTSAASLVFQVAILKRKGQSTSELTGGQVTFGLGVGDIDGGDLEGSLGGWRAARRSLRQSRSGECEDSERLHFQKIVRAGGEVAKVVKKGRLMNEVSVFLVKGY